MGGRGTEGRARRALVVVVVVPGPPLLRFSLAPVALSSLRGKGSHDCRELLGAAWATLSRVLRCPPHFPSKSPGYAVLPVFGVLPQSGDVTVTGAAH